MNVAVIGANGQLGSDLVEACRLAGWETAELTHEQLRVEEEDSVRTVLSALRPDVVLNTAASHHVPRCEQDPARAFAVNSTGARNVARVARELGCRLVHYSTDYVFDGARSSPYVESDVPNPLNVYAVSKLAGEHLVLNSGAEALVLRISGIYGRVPCRAKGGNFITTMRKAAREKPEVRVVNDEVLSPTPTRQIAEKTVELVRHDVRGLLHLTAAGSCSWYEFARVIFETLGLTTPLSACSSTEFPPAVRRPAYSAMESARWKGLPIEPIPHWRECLVTFLQQESG
jgi:dTDP-4-dehydrorhamnose reductase